MSRSSADPSTDNGDSLRSVFVDPSTNKPLAWNERGLVDEDGDVRVVVRNGIPRFVDDPTHKNFEMQWKKFSHVQLDSVNGSNHSRRRLFVQSGLAAEDFAGKTVLEVGCGAGRFTEVLLSLGARVVSLDYSGAVEANARTHADAVAEGRLVCAQGNVFELPVADESFEMVFCYGVVQHTGDARRATRSLWAKVKPGGLLLVDRYRISLQNVMPMKYLLRPITTRVPNDRLLSVVERYVETVFPIQLRVFGALQGSGPIRLVRMVANRWTLNAVSSLNMHLQGEIDEDIALAWSILDTFDMYSPVFDEPQTHRAFRREIDTLSGGEVVRCSTCGQGNTATVRRQRA